MFDKKEMHQLREVVTDVVTTVVTTIVDKKIDSLMEHQLLPQFQLLHERIDGVEGRMDGLETRIDTLATKKDLARVENTMATKSFVEERLERFRIDLGLKYRKAI